MKKALLIVCAVICTVFFASAQQSSEQVSKIKQSLKSIDWTPKYKGEVNVGYAITGSKPRFYYQFESSDSDGDENIGYDYGKRNTILSRPLFETVHGVEIGPYFFVGAGVGLQYYCGKLKDFQEFADWAAEVNFTKEKQRWNSVMLPIFANIKFIYPVNESLSPFLNLSLGGTVGCYSSVDLTDEGRYGGEEWYESYGSYVDKVRARGGFYCDFGAGVRYKSLNVSIGLQHQVFRLVEQHEDMDDGLGEFYSEKMCYSTNNNAFYVKVGVNF